VLEVLPVPAAQAPEASPDDPAAVAPVQKPCALVLKHAVVPKRAVVRSPAASHTARNLVKLRFHHARAS
jgi:hypothetical protein